METRPQTSKDYFRALQIIYFALVTGQVLFGLIALFLRLNTGFDAGLADLRHIFLYIVPVFVIGGYLGSRLLFSNRLKAAKNRPGLAEKLVYYRAALILKYALLEGPTMLAIIVYLITGDISFLAIAGMIIVIFFTMMPTKSQAVIDLALSPAEEQAILDPDRVISETPLN